MTKVDIEFIFVAVVLLKNFIQQFLCKICHLCIQYFQMIHHHMFAVGFVLCFEIQEALQAPEFYDIYILAQYHILHATNCFATNERSAQS